MQAHELHPRVVADGVGPLGLRVQPGEGVTGEAVDVGAVGAEAEGHEGEPGGAAEEIGGPRASGEGQEPQGNRDQDAVRAGERGEPAEQARPAPPRGDRRRHGRDAREQEQRLGVDLGEEEREGKDGDVQERAPGPFAIAAERQHREAVEHREPEEEARVGEGDPRDPQRPVAPAEGPGERAHRHRVQGEERDAALSRGAPVVAPPGDVEVPARVPGREGVREALRLEGHREGPWPRGREEHAREERGALGEQVHREHRDQRVESGCRPGSPLLEGRGSLSSTPDRVAQEAAQPGRSGDGGAHARQEEQHQERLREAPDADEAEVEPAHHQVRGAGDGARRHEAVEERERALGGTEPVRVGRLVVAGS